MADWASINHELMPALYLQASLTCSVAPDAQIVNVSNLGGPDGKEVFSEKKGLSIFKDKVGTKSNRHMHTM